MTMVASPGSRPSGLASHRSGIDQAGGLLAGGITDAFA
jgi:hypothetical protein